MGFIAKSSISADAAFISSVCSTWRLQQCMYPRAGYIESSQILASSGIVSPTLVPRTSNFLNFNPLIPFKKDFIQKKFMIRINENIQANLFNEFDMRRRTIVTGRSCHGASYWLTNPPNWEDNSSIDAAPFRLLLKFSLGMPVLQTPQPCPDCGAIMDIFGDHAVTCRTAGGVIDKHNSIVKCLAAKMKMVGINCSYEVMNLNHDSRQRPGDIFIPEFDVFGDGYLDVSVINTTCSSYLTQSSKGQLFGAEIRYSMKSKKYPDLGPRFKPLVVESTGGWHRYSMDVLKLIAGHIASRCTTQTSSVLNNLLMGCSFALQKHLGTMMVRRCLGL